LVPYRRILVRATNWVGDAVMSLPALRALRERFPQAEIAILAKPWVADLYRREPFCDQLIPYTAQDLPAKMRAARELRPLGFDCAILLQNAFEAGLVAFVARFRSASATHATAEVCCLTRAIEVPAAGEIPLHERFYYLEMLRRAGIIDETENDRIQLDGAAVARVAGIERFAAIRFRRTVIGVSPGAAFGTAKRWLPSDSRKLRRAWRRNSAGSVAIFGSASERELCDSVAQAIAGPLKIPTKNYAGETTLAEFIELAAACRVYLTNDSGAMHIASALGVPTVAVFGATNDITTGPTGAHARVVREKVECSPCLRRECPSTIAA
jgi:heptosyltransferase-2